MSLETTPEVLRTDIRIPLPHLKDHKVMFFDRRELGRGRLCSLLSQDGQVYVRANGHFHPLEKGKSVEVPHGPTFTLMSREKIVLVSKGRGDPRLTYLSSMVLEAERSAWHHSLSEQETASLKAVRSNKRLAVLAVLGLAVLGGMAVGLKQCVLAKVDQEAASD